MISQVVAWLKKWWGLLVVGALLLLGALVEIFRSKPSPSSDATRRIVEKDTSDAERKAAEEHVVVIETAYQEHEKSQAAITQQVTQTTAQVQDNPRAVNDYLQQVGKNMRGGS